MATPVTIQKKSEDPVLIKRELEAVQKIHDALMAVPQDRRTAILRAVAILLQIYIPSE